MSKLSAQKAWITRKRNILVEAYQNATSAGLKAGIARQFKNEFNIVLKDYIAKNTKKTKQTK
jgi:hypothetical protein